MKNLSFEKFEKIMLYLQRYDELADKVGEICNEISSDFPPFNLFGLATQHSDYIVDLLKFIFDDESGYPEIEYWMYELDYGKKYTKGCVTESDGTEIKLETIRDLYDLLIANKEQQS